MYKIRYGLILSLVFFLGACATPGPKTSELPKSHSGAAFTPKRISPNIQTRGLASWYGGRTRKKRQSRTASGERLDGRLMTAAHRSLPFGTKIRVRELHTGREVIVRVNDRGPYIEGRIIDLSYGAGRALGILGSGVARVEIEVLDPSVPTDLVW